MTVQVPVVGRVNPTPREQAKVHELRPINKMADVAAAAADALLRSILPAEPSRVSEFKVHLFSNMRMCCFEALTQKLKSCQQPKIVLPGDKVTETIQNLHTSARIGSTKSANTAVQCACMILSTATHFQAAVSNRMVERL